ncbi:hypothetical protein B0H17DRAFT_1206208 [Mycena rosella]|uniref:Uncharacterized protein n=1 Tax=Mycena rosella TaxID=1033263 RepID=A0AAD7GBX5_MYCRO|nr:hypothetical protein B0H17DRAFT_1206208 [Mycena rosella]
MMILTFECLIIRASIGDKSVEQILRLEFEIRSDRHPVQVNNLANPNVFKIFPAIPEVLLIEFTHFGIPTSVFTVFLFLHVKFCTDIKVNVHKEKVKVEPTSNKTEMVE